jgi:hypothetical protein
VAPAAAPASQPTAQTQQIQKGLQVIQDLNIQPPAPPAAKIAAVTIQKVVQSIPTPAPARTGVAWGKGDGAWGGWGNRHGVQTDGSAARTASITPSPAGLGIAATRPGVAAVQAPRPDVTSIAKVSPAAVPAQVNRVISAPAVAPPAVPLPAATPAVTSAKIAPAVSPVPSVPQANVAPAQVNVSPVPATASVPASVSRPSGAPVAAIAVDRAIKIDSTSAIGAAAIVGKTMAPVVTPPVRPTDTRAAQDQRDRLQRLEQADRLTNRGKKGHGSTP